jgi:hypothetical protein
MMSVDCILYYFLLLAIVGPFPTPVFLLAPEDLFLTFDHGMTKKNTCYMIWEELSIERRYHHHRHRHHHRPHHHHQTTRATNQNKTRLNSRLFPESSALAHFHPSFFFGAWTETSLYDRAISSRALLSLAFLFSLLCLLGILSSLCGLQHGDFGKGKKASNERWTLDFLMYHRQGNSFPLCAVLE